MPLLFTFPRLSKTANVLYQRIIYTTNLSHLIIDIMQELFKEGFSFILQQSEELDLRRAIYFHLKHLDSDFIREPTQRLEASLWGWTSEPKTRIALLGFEPMSLLWLLSTASAPSPRDAFGGVVLERLLSRARRTHPILRNAS